MCWLDDSIVDWANMGTQYFLDGQTNQLGKYGFAFPFDSAAIADDGQYAFIYQKLGTKGLLLKNGEVLREINRSYYHADVYEYPIAFVTAQNGVTYLIHCPNDYCQIDFEEVESGKIITNIAERNAADFFHSRFEISPDKTTLISKGWAWHPYDAILYFDIEACLQNPLLLDKINMIPDVDAEIFAASFINNDLILIGFANEDDSSTHLYLGQMAVWNFKTNTVSEPIKTEFMIGGHLRAIDETYTWDLYEYPKIINYKTGKIVDKIEAIFSGNQTSSIIHHLNGLPKIAFDKHTKQVAIANEDKIEILSI